VARDWQPDVEIDLASAHAIVTAQFPEFTAREPKFLGRGWDNFCLIYGGDIVFKLPTRRLGAELTGVETRVLPELQSLPLPVPNPRYLGRPDNRYPYAFVGYPLVPGEALDQAKLTQTETALAAAQLGHFLRELHATPPPTNLPAYDKTSPEGQLKRIQTRVTQIDQARPDLQAITAQALRSAHDLATQSATFNSADATLVHGDFYTRHVLARDGRLTGVIDWGDVHLGDPIGDLAIAYLWLKPKDREILFAAYNKELSTQDLNRAELRALMYALALLAYAIDEALPDLEATSLRALR
jgi:aminoglycoside phosphotransferase (APT) family kinase protein